MFRSIRFRIALWYTILVALTFVLVAWVIYEYVNRTLTHSLDQSIINEVKWVSARMEKRLTRIESDDMIREDIFEHAAFFPLKEYIEIWDANGRIFYHSPNLGVEDTLKHHLELTGSWNSALATTSTFRKHEIRIAVERTPNAIVYLGMPTESITTAVNQLLRIFAWLFPVIILSAVVIGSYLARKSFSKVNRVVDTAKRITADRLYDRIPEHDTNDEIGEIISTFNAMISRLDVSFSQMRQFSADASHELRTPLTVIRSQLETALNSKISPAELKKIIANCLDESLRMSDIIESLLLLAKADAGQDVIRRDPVNLKTLINQTYEESIIIASQKEIIVMLDEPADVTIMGDAQRLRQMLLNLIDNAVKYNRVKGSIRLALSRENGSALIRVSDSGYGMPSEAIPHIFDRFYRADRARHREHGGAGLGLSIVRWVVQAHGGSITVTSTLNIGSEFLVALPLE